jgi:hypothetical protein
MAEVGRDGSQKFQMTSGAELIVTPAPFEDAEELKIAILSAVAGKGLGDVDVDELHKMAGGEVPAGLFLEKLLSLAASREVTKAILRCGQRALYAGKHKVGAELFDDPGFGQQARRDYLGICARIVEVNFLPFFASVFSLSKAPRPILAGAPASV